MVIYDVVVVGAGPAGCRTAELVAKEGYKVLLLEEHKKAGEPVQCAGLVSWRVKSLVHDLPPDIVLNTVHAAKFFSPRTNFELESAEPVYVIDRAKFDTHLSQRAKAAGVKIKLGTRFESFKRYKDFIELTTARGRVKTKFKTKILVGADGPNSAVAQSAQIRQPDNYLVGIQTTVNGIFDPGAVELWFDNDVSPEFFGWVVPLNGGSARIGLATRASENANGNVKEKLDNFLRKRIGTYDIKPDVVGRINFGLIGTSVVGRVLLVGDAACQIKPFSGGGVVYGLIGAGYCARACVEALKTENFSAEFLKREYDKKWKRQLAKPIRRGMLYRKVIYGFDGRASNARFNFTLRLAKIFKFVLKSLDMDLL